MGMATVCFDQTYEGFLIADQCGCLSLVIECDRFFFHPKMYVLMEDVCGRHNPQKSNH